MRTEHSRYIITGGAGFIGSHIVDRLLAEGHTVTVVDDFSSGREENLAQHADAEHLQIVRRSVTEPLDDLYAQPVAATFHLAAIPSVQQSIADPEGTRHVNVDGTMNVLDACRKYGGRFILASSAAVYGSQPSPHVETMEPQPLSPYAEHKLAGERAIADYRREYGTLASALRCFNVYGPRQRPDSEYSGVISKFSSRLAAGQPVTIYGDGEQTRDFVFVADVVQAYIRAATVDLDGPVNIGTGSSVSVNKLLATLAQVLGVEVEPQHGPAVAEVRHSLADVTRAKQLLDWQARIGLADGLAQTIANIRP